MTYVLFSMLVGAIVGGGYGWRKTQRMTQIVQQIRDDHKELIALADPSEHVALMRKARAQDIGRMHSMRHFAIKISVAVGGLVGAIVGLVLSLAYA